MAANKWPKWAVGISGVLSFTGFLYMIQKENLAASAPGTETQGWSGPVRQDAARHEFYATDRMPESLRGEIFLFEAERIDEMLNWTDAQKSKRERLLESLNWEADPDAEMTIPAPAEPEERIQQARPRSNVQTRRS